MLTAHLSHQNVLFKEKLDLELGDQPLKMEAIRNRKNHLSPAQPNFSPTHTTATAYLSLCLF